MRIIDKRKDYYDSVQKNDEDRTLVYNRKLTEYRGEKEIYSEFGIHSLEPTWKTHYNSPEFVHYIIGFCGKLYNCFKHEDRFYYDAQSVIDFHVKYYEVKKNHRFYKDVIKELEKKILKLFNDFPKKHEIIFQKSLSPIFIYRGDKPSFSPTLVINPLLREYEFFKLFDTYNSYQEISMFLGALAFLEKPLPSISNETMRDIKGFDKYSFKKDKKC